MEFLQLRIYLNKSLDEFIVVQSLAIIYSELSIVPYCLLLLLPFQVVAFGTVGVNSVVFISSMLPCISILARYFAIIPCSLL